MSLRLNVAAERAYDELKFRPGARPRRSGARDKTALASVENRLRELIGAYHLHGHDENGATYLFWTDVEREIRAGRFDDLLSLL